MTYIIEVTEHRTGNVSVKVTDTAGFRDATKPAYVYERHQFSDRRTAFDYGNRALAAHIDAQTNVDGLVTEIDVPDASLSVDHILRAHINGLITFKRAMHQLQLEHNMTHAEAHACLTAESISAPEME